MMALFLGRAETRRHFMDLIHIDTRGNGPITHKIWGAGGFSNL